MSATQTTQRGLGSPIDNEAYNVLTALQTKLEGLEAMRQYGQESDTSLWQQVSALDQQAVTLLAGQLERLVKEGRLHARQPVIPAR